jgi:ADP-heptose:LPS heptosyltransferase
VNPEWAPLLAGNPCLDDVIEFPRKKLGGVLGWTRFPGWLRALRERVKPDVVLDFQGLFRSALIARGVGGESWGMSDSREGARLLHRHIVPVAARGEPVHAVQRNLALAAALGCDTGGPLEWPLPQGSAPAGLPARYVVLHPFSRGAGKSLTCAEVVAFCKAHASGKVVIAGRSEVELPVLENAINLLNRTTLPELCWLLRHADFVVSVDSGPMHMAAALTERLLAIHTWSDPRCVGPAQPRAWVWKDGRIGRMADFPNGEPCPREQLAFFTA